MPKSVDRADTIARSQDNFLMALAFKAEALSLGSLLSGDRRFAIPVFQRGYSWTSREVGQLTSDLWQSLRESQLAAGARGELLLGSIVVFDGSSRVAGKSAAAVDQSPAAWVIDGKQRLTTLTILLAALRDVLGDDAAWISDLIWCSGAADHADRWVPRLQLDLEEDAYFGVQARRPGASLDPLEPDGENKGRRGIRECQQAIVDDFEGRSQQDLLALAHHLRNQVALVLISAPDIETGFRIFVTTNHRGKPLSATDILKAELMADVPDDKREQRLEQWRVAERMLGGDFEDLPGYLRTVHGRANGSNIRDVLELSQRKGGASTFLDTLLFPLADQLLPILNASHAGSPQSARINRSLGFLNWLRARDWVPPALAFVDRFPGRNEDFAAFLEALDRLAYGMQIMGFGADRRVTRYRAVIEAMNSGMSEDGLTLQLALSDEEQWNVLLNASSNLYQRSQSTCKILLKRLSASYPGDAPMTSLTDVSVEHVLPRNLAADSPWRLQIPNAEEREACSKLLGNLVLVTKQQNKEARNHAFEVKQGVFFADGNTSPHAITNQIMRQRHWRAEEIRARDADLLRRMAEIWQLKGRAGGRRGKPAR